MRIAAQEITTMVPNLDSVPVHDEAAALELMEGERELLEEVLELYRESTPERITDLTAAVEAGDLEAVGRAAHAIKGSSSNIGAERLRVLACQLEADCRKGDDSSVREVADMIVAEFKRFDTEVNFVA